MRTFAIGLFLAAATVAYSMIQAQPTTQPTDSVGVVARFMAFDKNGDGKLTKEELTDTRLHRLLDRADKKGAGFVTKEDLTAMAAALGTDRGAARDLEGSPREGSGHQGRQEPVTASAS